MKIKNNYIIAFIIWVIVTLFDTITSFVAFVDGNLVIGAIFFICAIAFSFISGTLLIKAIEIYEHNKEVEFLEYIKEVLKKEQIEKIEPFEDFGGNNDR